MRNGNFYYIDLFDEYEAMRMSWKELKNLVDTHCPHIDVEAELAGYQQARECLQMRAIKQNFEEILCLETKA